MAPARRDDEGAHRGVRRRSHSRDLLSVAGIVAAVAIAAAALVGPATSNLAPILRPAENTGAARDAEPESRDSIAVEIRDALRAPAALFTSPRTAAIVAAPALIDFSAPSASPVSSVEGSSSPDAATGAADSLAPLFALPVGEIGAAPAPALVVEPVTEREPIVVLTASTKGKGRKAHVAATPTRTRRSSVASTSTGTVSTFTAASLDDGEKSDAAVGRSYVARAHADGSDDRRNDGANRAANGNAERADDDGSEGSCPRS